MNRFQDGLFKFTLVLLLSPIIWATMEHEHRPTDLDVQFVYIDGAVQRKHHPLRSLFHHKPKPERPNVPQWCGLGRYDPTEVYAEPTECWLVFEIVWKGEIEWILNEEPATVTIYV